MTKFPMVSETIQPDRGASKRVPCPQSIIKGISEHREHLESHCRGRRTAVSTEQRQATDREQEHRAEAGNHQPKEAGDRQGAMGRGRRPIGSNGQRHTAELVHPRINRLLSGAESTENI